MVNTGAARAQSISSGSLAGTVNDNAGRPLRNARVELMDLASGLRRSQRTGGDGRFSLAFLPPGEYVLLAEQLGYRPVEVHGLAVEAADEVTLALVLEPADPPVRDRAIERHAAGAVTHDDAGAAWQLGRLQLRRLPDDARAIGSALRFTTIGDDDLAIEGLPGRFTVLAVDGIPFRLAHHSVSGWREGTTLAFPLLGVASARVDPGGLDVEWGDYAGGRLSVVGPRGGSRVTARAFGDWTGSDLTRSKYYSPENLSGQSFRGGLLASGPVIRDTAHFVLGVEGSRLRLPLPPLWEATGIDSAVTAIAADSFGVDLGPLRQGRVADVRSASGFGRFDWQASEGNRLSVWANAALLEATDPPVAPGAIPAPAASLEGSDVTAAATLASRLSRGVALELRAGFETARRVYGDDGRALTILPSGPIAFGTDAGLPGKFRRTAFRLSETLHLWAGRHRLKLGMGGGVTASGDAFVAGRGGAFVFGGPDQLATRTGGFDQTTGVTGTGFSAIKLSGFLQDRWRAMPGVDILVGLRTEWERVRSDEVAANAAWLARSGVRNDSFDGTVLTFSPRGGLLWDVGNRHRWVVRIDGGMYRGSLAGDELAEAVATASRTEGRLGVGAFNRWPTPPDSVTAPIAGPSLAVLSPSLQAPRTARAQFGIAGALGGGVSLHLGVSFRHTDFLTRRHDLNLLAAPAARDQYGRPVFGRLSPSGSALLAVPESNRRFDDFAQVIALDQDGYSEYVGLTGRLEKQVGDVLLLSAGYTYSRTEDNWLGARGSPDMQLSPFPGNLNGADWADGRSDFDVPHRLVLGAEVNLGVARVAGFYGYRSGYPFTPGFRDGVDANADGSWRNDPAYVDGALPGVTDLFAEWTCLDRNAGGFAERNACRGPAIQRLDARLVLGPFRLGAPVEIVLDALNLLDAEYVEVDRALFLVDPAGTVTEDPAAGTVTVPLVANPGFGRPIRRYGSGRTLRLGLRVNYE